ncbi:IMP 5'-nucleotidase [Orbilia brochopaga]|uniref:IMP-specific 5'-nucleotidase 1 n=1 Tax=Orbilia brochopaga TaxID=3140254 RepID=A0AAV9UGV6_9PEZI
MSRLLGIKGLLAVPFVLHSQPNAALTDVRTDDTVSNARRRYAEIMRDVEQLVNDHIEHQRRGIPERSKLKLLVPSLSIFFTPLMLEEAFMAQDARRAISSRRFVSPSFNDIRLILNTAQIMSLVKGGPLKLVTFDGDVTLYDDGASLIPSNQVISRILDLMSMGICVGVVTAAGYEEAKRYNDRLHGLLEAVHNSESLTETQKKNLVVLGGEANFMFRFNSQVPHLLEPVPRDMWALDEMKAWKDEDITELLDISEATLRDSVKTMRLKADIVRKSRAVGIIPQAGTKFFREQLEETVLAAQKVLELSDVGRRLPFCAFNGGNDVFVDIGDKRLGVACCQRLFGDIQGLNTLHVGDQFLSISGNDFKTRMVCTTCWVASPAETVDILDEFLELASR